MKRCLSVLRLAAMLALSAFALQAQTLSHMIRDTGLTPEDFTMMDEAASGLYTADRPQTGSEASWSNPDSMSHGTVRLEAMREHLAGRCARPRHFRAWVVFDCPLPRMPPWCQWSRPLSRHRLLR